MEILFGLMAIAIAAVAMIRSRRAAEAVEKQADRLHALELEFYALRKSRSQLPATPPVAEEKPPGFAPAVLPPRKPDAEFFPPPVIPAEPVIPALARSEEIPPMVSYAPPPAIAPPPPMREVAALTEPELVPPPEDFSRPPLIPPAAALAPAPAAEKVSFEMRLGTYWLVRIGIVMLLTGLAFFGNYAYHNIVGKLGPGGKISLLYLASGLLLGAGAWWQRSAAKAALKNYAQVLFAGGLAAIYFTTYAAHHIPPLCIIASATLDGALLLAWAGVIAWVADRRQSEVMALFAVGLAFYSSVITRVGDFTLWSNLVLTVAAVVFLLRNRWASLSFAGLATSYAGYAFWRFLHEDGWRWAAANERLYFGASFLAAYWLVFTVATFLSRCEKLSGASRATFLTLNNGAFFSLFLLTMLQVHTGGFWKVGFGYGGVLLALAGLAKKMFPTEPAAKNAYLTQGLLLITLGFITKFTGFQLALMLGAESVVLFVLGAQRASLVLKFFAYAAALLATGWFGASLNFFDAHGVATGVGLGGLLAVNALWALRQERKIERENGRLESTTFTLLAFVVWTATTWFHSAAPHLPVALVLGVASIVLFNLIAARKVAAPKIAAYASAVIAVMWGVTNLSPFASAGLWAGIVLGALMLVNALAAHREMAADSAPFRVEPAAFTLFALVSWLATTWFNASPEHLPLVLAAEAVALTFSIYLLRVREVVLFGQTFLVLAQAAWLFHFLNATPPWWNPLLLIAATVGLSHWWQKQKTMVVDAKFGTGCQALFAFAAVALVFVWLHPLFGAPAWLALTSLLAVAATIYGVTTRAWPLAACGQIFLAVSAWEFFTQVWTQKPDWFFPLAPVVVLGTMSLVAVRWLARHAETPGTVAQPLLQVALVYRWAALAMAMCWLWQYVPERQHVAAFMAVAIGFFGLAVWRRQPEALAGAAVYVVVALATLWAREDFAMDVYWLNLVSLLALLLAQIILRRAAERLVVAEKIHGAIIVITGLSLWRLVSCWAATFTGGFFITMIWAGLALIGFAAGMILRERFHRWFGLGGLAAAVGRVVLVDVWKQETIWRVLTFLALGVALLLIGFVYTKYQDTIRKWL